MRSTQAYHDDEYLREVWILYGIGLLIYFLRFCVRLRTVGIRHFQGDDWMSIAVLLCYTADALTVTFTYLLGSNVDWPPETLDQFNAQQIDNIILGSKLQLVAWYTYTALIWGLKACMLFFFNRLTFGLNVQTYVKILAVACGATYIAVFLTISVGCHPIQKNWAVDPYPPAECTLRSQNMYVTTVLNVITDAAMLCIPRKFIELARCCGLFDLLIKAYSSDSLEAQSSPKEEAHPCGTSFLWHLRHHCCHCPDRDDFEGSSLRFNH